MLCSGTRDHPRGPHAAGQLQAVGVGVAHHHEARPGVPGDAGGHDPDGPRPGDQHVLAQQVERQRRVRGVAQRVEAGQDLQRDARVGVPDVGLRHAQVLGEAALAVHPHPAGAGAQVTPARQAVAAVPADQVALPAHRLAGEKVPDHGAHALHDAGELVPDHQGHRHVLRGPGVPVVDVQVRAADGGFPDADQHVGGADFRLAHLLQPEPGLGPLLDQSLHGRPVSSASSKPGSASCWALTERPASRASPRRMRSWSRSLPREATARSVSPT